MARLLIDRRELSYDVFVLDPSWLGPIDASEEDEEGGVPDHSAMIIINGRPTGVS